MSVALIKCTSSNIWKCFMCTFTDVHGSQQHHLFQAILGPWWYVHNVRTAHCFLHMVISHIIYFMRCRFHTHIHTFLRMNITKWPLDTNRYVHTFYLSIVCSGPLIYIFFLRSFCFSPLFINFVPFFFIIIFHFLTSRLFSFQACMWYVLNTMYFVRILGNIFLLWL